MEEGYRDDSSIYPAHYDRYSVPLAPRTPFYAEGRRHRILETPPATLHLVGVKSPVGGGGYFRLLPLFFLHWAISQTRRLGEPPVVMLYFHTWKFDNARRRLPLQGLRHFCTYVGLSRSHRRLETLLDGYRFTRAEDVSGSSKSNRMSRSTGWGQLDAVRRKRGRSASSTARPGRACT